MTETNTEMFNFSLIDGSMGILDDIDSQKYKESLESSKEDKTPKSGVAKALEEKTPISTVTDEATAEGLENLDNEYYKSLKEESTSDKVNEDEGKETKDKNVEDVKNTFKVLLEDVFKTEVPEGIELTDETFAQLAEEAVLNKIKKDLGSDGMEVLEHLKNGGSLQDYFEIAASDDLTTFDLKENTFNQKYMLQSYLGKTTQWSEEEINDYIDTLDEEKLLAKSTKAQTDWGVLQTKEKEEALNKAKTQKEANQKQVAAIQNLLKESIYNKTAFNGLNLNLTPKVKQELTDYMLKPTVKLPDGRTVSQNEADYMQEVKDMREAKNADGAIIQAYQRMKKYNIVGSLTKEQAKEQSKSLADKLKASGEGRIKSTGTDAPKLNEDVKEKTIFRFTNVNKSLV